MSTASLSHKAIAEGHNSEKQRRVLIIDGRTDLVDKIADQLNAAASGVQLSGLSNVGESDAIAGAAKLLEPIVTDEYSPAAANDRKVVRDLSNQVRDAMQAAIDDMQSRRRSIFYGSVFRTDLMDDETTPSFDVTDVVEDMQKTRDIA